MLFPALITLWSLLKCFPVQNCGLFSEKVLDFAVQIYYNKYIIISVEVSKCNTLRQLRQRICVRALRRADAASARHPASQHARQAAVSQISSARIKRKASNHAFQKRRRDGGVFCRYPHGSADCRMYILTLRRNVYLDLMPDLAEE